MAITSSVVSNTTTTRIFLASGDQAITTIMFCNFDSATSAFLDVYAVANGGVVSTGTQILKYISLPPTETFVMDTEKLILANGDAIWAQTSSTSECVSASVSSVGI